MEKYSLPSTHEAFQESTTFDLLVEFYEDLFEKDSSAMLEAGRREDGEIEFEETGDPLIDKWERELSLGLDPDLTEGLSTTSKALLEKEKNKKKRVKQVQNELFGSEDYSNLDILGKTK